MLLKLINMHNKSNNKENKIMSTQTCSNCGHEVSSNAFNCSNCGTVFTNEKGRFDNIISTFESKSNLNLTGNVWKTLGWFGIANASVILSVAIMTGGALLGYAPFLLVIGSVFPMISLLFSKFLAKFTHNIQLINNTHFRSKYEEDLYRLIERLSIRAGLDKMPEVGVYESNDMNAFATGFNRNNSLIAFSTELIQSMSEEEIAAVAAHEMAHIANGDMITMAIVQSVVNAFVLLLTLPLRFIHFFARYSREVGFVTELIISLVKLVVTVILMFLGNLVVKAFSRKREYEADKLAAQLIDKKPMITALKTLSTETSIIPKAQKEFAALKISTPITIMEIFSTHPPLEKRIQRLQDLDTTTSQVE